MPPKDSSRRARRASSSAPPPADSSAPPAEYIFRASAASAAASSSAADSTAPAAPPKRRKKISIYKYALIGSGSVERAIETVGRRTRGAASSEKKKDPNEGLDREDPTCSNCGKQGADYYSEGLTERGFLCPECGNWLQEHLVARPASEWTESETQDEGEAQDEDNDNANAAATSTPEPTQDEREVTASPARSNTSPTAAVNASSTAPAPSSVPSPAAPSASPTNDPPPPWETDTADFLTAAEASTLLPLLDRALHRYADSIDDANMWIDLAATMDATYAHLFVAAHTPLASRIPNDDGTRQFTILHRARESGIVRVPARLAELALRLEGVQGLIRRSEYNLAHPQFNGGVPGPNGEAAPWISEEARARLYGEDGDLSEVGRMALGVPEGWRRRRRRDGDEE